MTHPTSNVRLKLLIDRETKSVLYGEADKDFIDFLFNLLSLPLGAVIKLLTKQHMIGCLGNLYESIETLNETCFIEPTQTKQTLLSPKVSLNCSNKLLPYITQISSSSIGDDPNSSTLSYSNCSSIGGASTSSISSYSHISFGAPLGPLSNSRSPFGAPSGTSRYSCSSFGASSSTLGFGLRSCSTPSSTLSYGHSSFDDHSSSTSSNSCSLFGDPCLSTSSNSHSPFGAPTSSTLFGFSSSTFSGGFSTFSIDRDIPSFGARLRNQSRVESMSCEAGSSNNSNKYNNSDGNDGGGLKVGFVKGLATYIVMDDLTVMHVSDFSLVSIFKKFNIKDADALEEKIIALNLDEGVELLRASLQSKMVLTEVFLRKERQIIDNYNDDEHNL